MIAQDAPGRPQEARGGDSGAAASPSEGGPERVSEALSVVRLTSRQAAVLDHIRRTVADRGYPPSIREIGDAVGLTSPSSVAWQLQALVAKGYLQRVPNQPRAMRVIEPTGGGEAA